MKWYYLFVTFFLTAVSNPLYACDKVEGTWQFSSTGSLSSIGVLTFDQVDKSNFTVLLDISSQRSEVQRAVGIAVCEGDKFTATIGGFPGKFGDLRVAGGTFVGYLDTAPLNYAFAAWEMLVIDVSTFQETTAIGFARLRKTSN